VISIYDCQAIFFDFDGVILESLDIKAEAFAGLYADKGFHTVAAVKKHFYRRTGISRHLKIRECHRQYLGADPSAEEVTALAERFGAQIDAGMLSCPMVPGALELLTALPDETLRFVVSGTPQEELRTQIEARGLAPHFTSVHGSPRDKVTIIETLKERHGVDPVRAVMIGDGILDHDAAVETGLNFLGRVAVGRQNPFPQTAETVADLGEWLGV
jgi:phosphoglycolate phosphatase-like HAD superfamily hydrolase